MKKIKKIMAMLLAMVMVLGMTVTASAAEELTITVNGEDGEPINVNAEDSKFEYVQVIKPERTARTGWTFTDDRYAKAYIDAFNIEGSDKVENAQRAIDKLILDDGKSAEVAKALKTITTIDGVFKKMDTNPLEVNTAGIYVIKASEAGYTYTNMAAYVGFGLVTNETYPELTSAEITAKRASVDISKKVTDPDKVVAIGDIITYTVETTVPFIDPEANKKEFKVWDKISGADYYFAGEGSHFSITMGDFEKVNVAPVIDPEDTNKFTVDLSDLINETNSNAGKKILIVYTAKVTSQKIENEVGSNVNGDTVDRGNVDVYTGSIKLTKYNENKTQKLEGAGFEVSAEGSKEKLTFRKDIGTEGHYTYDPEGRITEVFTGSDGTLVLAGLDLGTYNFKETTAPEGYHVKNDPSGIDATAILKLKEGETEAEDIVTVDTELTNTKLSSLPSTGGIGTTIFTIGGCAIMVAAAGLFFASRRKANK